MIQRFAIAAAICLGWLSASAAAGEDQVNALLAPGAPDVRRPGAAAGAAGEKPDTPQIAAPKLDAPAFFQRVVDRYRGLHTYRDRATVVQVLNRAGRESNRIETEIGCEIREGALHVQTPQSQLIEALGLSLPVRESAAMDEAARRFDLWLAPHMALKFTDEPLKELRSGVEEGFTPTEAHAVVLDNKKMVHVELRSGDGLSESCAAKFDLFVNPETMLVERIEGAQLLPDGANYSTTLHITPERAEGGGPPAASTRTDPAA